MDKHGAVVSEEFYDNLVTCDIKSVDALITALLVEPSTMQRLKGKLFFFLNPALLAMCTDFCCDRGKF